MKESPNCIGHAYNAYFRRASTDTNPSIAQLLTPDGERAAHFYYKSDEVVSTSEFEWPEFFPEYEGPISGVPDDIKRHFLEGRFVIVDFFTGCVKKCLERGCKSWEEASLMHFGWGDD